MSAAHPNSGGSLPHVENAAAPTVVHVLRFEDLPLGSSGSRRAIARWSDGTEGEALTWFADEIIVC